MAMLSERIKKLRKSAGMTQEQFGEEFGIVKSTVSLYESGKSTPNDEIKKRICEYFDVSLDFLLGISDSKKPSTTSAQKTYCSFFGNNKALKKDFFNRVKTCIDNSGMTKNEFISNFPLGEKLANSFLNNNDNFMISDLLELSRFLNVTIDYLLGCTISNNSLSSNLLNTFNELSSDNKFIIVGEAKKLLREQHREKSDLFSGVPRTEAELDELLHQQELLRNQSKIG